MVDTHCPFPITQRSSIFHSRQTCDFGTVDPWIDL